MPCAFVTRLTLRRRVDLCPEKPQILCENACGLKAFVFVLGKGFVDQLLTWFDDPGVDGTESGVLDLCDLIEKLGHGLALEGKRPRQQLVENHAQGKDILPPIDLMPFNLLRGHVVGCSQDNAGLGVAR
jgi:hypothetical protein